MPGIREAPVESGHSFVFFPLGLPDFVEFFSSHSSVPPPSLHPLAPPPSALRLVWIFPCSPLLLQPAIINNIEIPSFSLRSGGQSSLDLRTGGRSGGVHRLYSAFSVMVRFG